MHMVKTPNFYNRPYMAFVFVGYCLPKFYFVPEECTQDERANPGSQRREPDPSPTLFLWGNALYIIASLLSESRSDASKRQFIDFVSS